MRILHFIGAILVLIATPAMAKAGPAGWTVMQKSGDVRVLRNGLQPASVRVRDALSPGDVVATGANGRAMLTRGEDYVVVAPGSRLLLPKDQQQNGFTRLIQQVGTMLYKVKHTGVPHFAVETPMLAAVVKGTSFTVVVDKDRAAVQVTDGIVEVSSAEGSARRLVERGLTVYVGRERPQQIIEMKPGAADLPSSSSDGGEAVKVEGSGDVPLSTLTDLTGGLIREVPAAPAVAIANTPTVKVTTLQPVAPVADTASTPVVAVADVNTPIATTPDVATPVATATPVTVTSVATTPISVTPVAVTPGTFATPAVTTPAVTTPTVGTPTVSTPIATVTPVTVATVTVPTVTVPAVTVSTPTVTPTTITTPTVTVPTLSTPTVSTPTVTTPTVATPIVTVPAVTVPTVTVPTVTVPAVTLPPVTLPLGGLFGGGNSGPGGGGGGPGPG
jgi:FecR protein